MHSQAVFVGSYTSWGTTWDSYNSTTASQSDESLNNVHSMLSYVQEQHYCNKSGSSTSIPDSMLDGSLNVSYCGDQQQFQAQPIYDVNRRIFNSTELQVGVAGYNGKNFAPSVNWVFGSSDNYQDKSTSVGNKEGSQNSRGVGSSLAFECPYLDSDSGPEGMLYDVNNGSVSGKSL